MQAEIFVLSMISLILVWDVFTRARFPGIVFGLTQLTLVGAGLITVFLTPAFDLLWHGMFINDQLGHLLKLGIYSLTFLVFWLGRQYIKSRRIPFAEYYLLALLAVLGMMLLVSAHNLMMIFLGVELSALPVYALVALWQDSSVGGEAAMKYFILGALASGMLLYGLSLLYGATGSLDIGVISRMTLAPALLLRFALVFMVAGIAFKFGAAPFHLWVPDVYAGAPAAVTLFISAAPKLAALGMAYRLLSDALPAMQVEWQQLLMVIAITSIVLGNLAAIMQTRLKRLLAYSSIAHMGYMSLGLLTDTSAGNAASLFYMLTYALTSVGALGLLTLLSRQQEIDDLTDLKGLNARHPWLAFMLLLMMFSMAGIPPTVGFFAKLGVLEALIDIHLVWLAVLALVFAVIGAYYYLNVIKIMYFEEDDGSKIYKISHSQRWVLSLSGLSILGLGMFPGFLFTLCHTAIT